MEITEIAYVSIAYVSYSLPHYVDKISTFQSILNNINGVIYLARKH